MVLLSFLAIYASAKDESYRVPYDEVNITCHNGETHERATELQKVPMFKSLLNNDSDYIPSAMGCRVESEGRNRWEEKKNGLSRCIFVKWMKESYNYIEIQCEDTSCQLEYVTFNNKTISEAAFPPKKKDEDDEDEEEERKSKATYAIYANNSCAARVMVDHEEIYTVRVGGNSTGNDSTKWDEKKINVTLLPAVKEKCTTAANSECLSFYKSRVGKNDTFPGGNQTRANICRSADDKQRCVLANWKKENTTYVEILCHDVTYCNVSLLFDNTTATNQTNLTEGNVCAKRIALNLTNFTNNPRFSLEWRMSGNDTALSYEANVTLNHETCDASKRTSGGTFPMIAVAIGACVLLLAVIGVATWYVKKPKTTKNVKKDNQRSKGKAPRTWKPVE